MATAATATDETQYDDEAALANATLAGDEIEVIVDEEGTEESADEGAEGGAEEAEESTDEGGTEEEAEESADEGADSGADDLDDPDDGEFTSFPAKVQKRIMRERRLARRERAEKDKLISERAQIIPAVQKLVGEKTAAEDEAFGLREAYVKLLDESLGREIEAVVQQLTVAKADGKDDDEIKAMSKLQELNARRIQAQDLVQQLERAKAGRPTAEDRKKAADAAAAAKPAPTNPLTQRWLERNKAWFNKPQFAAESGAARAIDQVLAQEGFDPATPAFFAEWDRRIDRKFPTLRKKGKAVTPAPVPVKKSPVAAVTPAAGGSRPSGTSKTQVRLGPKDIKFLRDDMKLDITDPEVLREYARNKMRSN